MKKKILALCLALVLIIALCPAAFAADYGVIYDETGTLDAELLQTYGELVLPEMTQWLGMDLRVDVLDYMAYDTVYETAANIYSDYDYGCGSLRRGISLTFYLTEQENGSCRMESVDDWCVYVGGSDEALRDYDIESLLSEAIAEVIDPAAWDTSDPETCTLALSQVLQTLIIDCCYIFPLSEDFFQGEYHQYWEALSEGEGISDIMDTVEDADDEGIGYVFDFADLLSFEQWMKLDQQAEEITKRYGVGVYIATVDNYEDYGEGKVYAVATQLYNDPENGFGVGDEHEGIILLLSMYDRDYALFVHGEKAEYAFNGHGQKLLEKTFLDNFGDDDWMGGFTDYLNTCDEYLSKADAGEPVRQSRAVYILGSVLASLVIAFVICSALKGQMKSVRQSVEASQYVVGNVNLTEKYDQYTHTTETRRVIEKNNSHSESGGGGSGRSGKF